MMGCVCRSQVWPTCLRVPQFDVAIVGGAQELGPRVVEANVSHCFAVALDWSRKSCTYYRQIRNSITYTLEKVIRLLTEVERHLMKLL